ncbi:hypothetical protein TNCV_4333561 [Trichonephila clavipes]|nr:hypothetical protein TNCV_4333561 [Trichonephila clavipes]
MVAPSIVMFYRPFENFTELNCTVTWCSRLRPATGVHPTHCHDEFRGPRSDYVRQRGSICVILNATAFVGCGICACRILCCVIVYDSFVGCVIYVRWLCWFRHVSDGMVDFVVDKWCHDFCNTLCTARIINEERLELGPKMGILATMPKRSSKHGGYYWFI